MPHADQRRDRAVRVAEGDVGDVVDARVPEAAGDLARATVGGLAEDPAQHVDVVDRVLEQRAAARLFDVGPPVGAVHALGREVLVVAQHRGQRPPVADRTRRPRPRRRNTGAWRSTSPTWCGTLLEQRAPTSSHSASVGASGFSQKTGDAAARPRHRRPSRCAAVQVHTHTTSTASSSASRSSCAAAPCGCGEARRRGAWSTSKVAVTAASTSPRVDERSQRERVDRPDEPAARRSRCAASSRRAAAFAAARAARSAAGTTASSP